MATLLQWDLRLLFWLNGWVGTFPLLDRAVSLVVSDYFIPVLLSLFLLGMWFGVPVPSLRQKYQKAVLIGIVGMGLGNLAVLLLNQVLYRPRPYVEHPEVVLFFYQPTDPSSFPSNPAVVGFALATGIASANPHLGAVALFLAGVWGLARITVGVSYPSDVVAGALLGATITRLAVLVFRFLEPLPTRLLQVAQRLYLA